MNEKNTTMDIKHYDFGRTPQEISSVVGPQGLSDRWSEMHMILEQYSQAPEGSPHFPLYLACVCIPAPAFTVSERGVPLRPKQRLASFCFDKKTK